VDVWFDGAPVASQTFPSLDVLRGAFGLITGPGEARFRNVRYLARDAADPGAVIERAVRLARARTAGQRRAGYHLGCEPPWPTAKAWVQAPATAWAQAGYAPTLVVLWSLEQNEIMPLHAWLTHLAGAYADVGLRIVSVCEQDDPDAVRAYLAEHRFPGSVAVDDFDPREGGVGKTMDRYAASRKGYPWVLLLDIDQKVVWEGNPGFTAKQPWEPGLLSYVETPLAELVERRGLRALGPWLLAWGASGLPALSGGAIESLIPLLQEARDLPGDVVPEVARAQGVLRDLRRVLEGFEATRAFVQEREADPALAVLIRLADRLEVRIDEDVRRKVERTLRGGAGRAWSLLDAPLETAGRRLAEGKEPAVALAPLMERLARAPGAVPALLHDELEAALATGAREAVEVALASGPLAPARWLASEVLGFVR
jgi:hypothetical protein